MTAASFVDSHPKEDSTTRSVRGRVRRSGLIGAQGRGSSRPSARSPFAQMHRPEPMSRVASPGQIVVALPEVFGGGKGSLRRRRPAPHGSGRAIHRERDEGSPAAAEVKVMAAGPRACRDGWRRTATASDSRGTRGKRPERSWRSVRARTAAEPACDPDEHPPLFLGECLTHHEESDKSTCGMANTPRRAVRRIRPHLACHATHSGAPGREASGGEREM